MIGRGLPCRAGVAGGEVGAVSLENVESFVVVDGGRIAPPSR